MNGVSCTGKLGFPCGQIGKDSGLNRRALLCGCGKIATFAASTDRKKKDMKKDKMPRLGLLGWVFAAMAFAGCSEVEDTSWKDGREVFMSGNVMFRIIFPETRDTILLQDRSSGFTTWIQDDSLYLRDLHIAHDTVVIDDVKNFVTLDVAFTSSTLRTVAEGLREVECTGEASVAYGTDQKNRTDAALLLPALSGTVEGNTMILSNGFQPQETRPYLVMECESKRISYGQ